MKVIRMVEVIMRKNTRHSTHEEPNRSVQQCLDTLKQKLSVYVSRLARYKKSNKRRNDNTVFNRNQKNFYRSLKQQPVSVNDDGQHLNLDDVELFWGTQLTSEVHFEAENSWIDSEEAKANQYSPMPNYALTSADISNAVRRLINWKSPGPDKIQNFWYKRFTSVHQKFAELVNHVIQHPSDMPEFLMMGMTYLLPKDHQNLQDPAKYRPITCLPTMYKIITSCITQKVNEHCEANNIIATQQKGCRKGSKGCKEQLTIDSVVCDQAFKNHRNLFIGYVDYKKAFDSVPHDWLVKVLQLYKIDPNTISFLSHIMGLWRTRLSFRSGSENYESNVINIRRGIFQGDSLSPLWFCLAMNPLSTQLNQTGFGFSIRNERRELDRLSHLLYMDDLKMYGSTFDQLNHMFDIVERFSNDIKMSFGLDKCSVVKIIRGKLQEQSLTTSSGQEIQALQSGEYYKYLGMKQSRRTEHKVIKEELTIEFCKRINMLLKSGLNSVNTFKAINTYAIPVLTYSFGIINWTKTDVEAFERKVRVLMTKARKHHPKSSIERMSLPRRMGGRGLINIPNLLACQLLSLRTYFYEESIRSPLLSAICKADKHSPLSLNQLDFQPSTRTELQRIEAWKAKALHGRHPEDLSANAVDVEASNAWLTEGQLFPETEGFMVAIQDQVIPTRNYLKHIVKDPSIENDKCRHGCQATENIQHITSGCQFLASTDYVARHDAVGKIIHQELALKYGLITQPKIPYYKYHPESVLENDDFKLYWDRSILTDRTVAHNRPDIVILNKVNKEAILIDVAIPNNNNIVTKHAEKVNKYRELSEIIVRQWGIRRIKTVPIIISSTGIIPRSLFENLSYLDLHRNIFKIMQKSVVLATCSLVRKFTNCGESGFN